MDVARETGFKVLVASFGSTALALVRQYRPSAVTLDISLPDMEGWRVLERLKSDFETRHVPVTVITTGGGGCSGPSTRWASRCGRGKACARRSRTS
jgi:CheY-like chemotaxis protein